MKSGKAAEVIRRFIASPCSSVSRPFSTASSMRFFNACSSASLSFAGSTPSCFAASFTIAWLSVFGVSRSAATATPAPTTVSAAPAPAASFVLFLIGCSLSSCLSSSNCSKRS